MTTWQLTFMTGFNPKSDTERSKVFNYWITITWKATTQSILVAGRSLCLHFASAAVNYKLTWVVWVNLHPTFTPQQPPSRMFSYRQDTAERSDDLWPAGRHLPLTSDREGLTWCQDEVQDEGTGSPSHTQWNPPPPKQLCWSQWQITEAVQCFHEHHKVLYYSTWNFDMVSFIAISL